MMTRTYTPRCPFGADFLADEVHSNTYDAGEWMADALADKINDRSAAIEADIQDWWSGMVAKYGLTVEYAEEEPGLCAPAPAADQVVMHMIPDGVQTRDVPTARFWFQTASGIEFDLENPTPAMIVSNDLFRSLSGIGRFLGHLNVPHYSVAQHSVLCAALVWNESRDPVATAAALLHDAHEAYTGDITSPVKAMIAEVAPGLLKAIERRIDGAIWSWSGLVYEYEDDRSRHGLLIKEMDLALLFWEKNRWGGKSPRLWEGEAAARPLTACEFGVAPGSLLLEPWSRDVAAAAFCTMLRVLVKDDGARAMLSIMPDGQPAFRFWLALEQQLGIAFNGLRGLP
jgi:hypothetical protein